VTRRSRYQGSAVQSVDAKNRVSIPAKFREAVIANSDPEDFKSGPYVILSLHPQFPCLIGYDPQWLEEEIARSEAIGQTASDGGVDPHYVALQSIAGGGEEVSFDSTGRCVLIGWHKRAAHIGEHAFFYGSLSHFEIWDPQTLLDHPDVSERAKLACRGTMEDKGLM
jgi:MraZ protein